MSTMKIKAMIKILKLENHPKMTEATQKMMKMNSEAKNKVLEKKRRKKERKKEVKVKERKKEIG